MTQLRPGVVSVVVVNYRGADDTIACVRSLAGLDWPPDRLEIVVVDNASGDGSVERLRAELPATVVVVASPTNTGFAGGCNLGVSHSSGEFIGLLNNDAKADSSWIAEAVHVLERDSGVAAVASRVLDWEGKHVDFVDAGLTWFGMGYKRETGWLDNARHHEPRDVLFATGSAMFVRTDVFLALGGFDERFFMFYEDVDLGWRLNLLGHRVRYVPSSVAFHKHHATISRFGSFRERYLLERNALMSLYKNYEDATLAHVLPAAMALAVKRSVSLGGADPTALDLQRSPGGDDQETLTVDKQLLTGPYAIDYLVDHLQELQNDRRRLQAARTRSDRDLLPLFRQALEPGYGAPAYVTAHADLIDVFGIEEIFAVRRRVLIVTEESLQTAAEERAVAIAAALSTDLDVVLATLGEDHGQGGRQFRVTAVTKRSVPGHASWADVLILPVGLLRRDPSLLGSTKLMVVDLGATPHSAVPDEVLRRADLFLVDHDQDVDAWLTRLSVLRGVAPTDDGCDDVRPMVTADLAALLHFCREPRRTAELVAELGPPSIPPRRYPVPRQSPVDYLVRIRALLAEEGPRHVAQKVVDRVRSQVSGLRRSR